jgi:hypothetical protein
MTAKFDYLHEAGKMREFVFQVGVRADPTLDNINSFAAILFFQKSNGEIVEVAKIDNTEHADGEIHIDRYYREQDADDKDFTVDVDDVWEADKHLKDNWQHYARTFLDNHGKSGKRR